MVKDQFAKFELGLPFNRIYLNNFLKKVDDALKECGDEGFVTVESLRTQFTTPAWADLQKPDS